MPQSPGFKTCETCHWSFPCSDGHSSCLWCLGNSQNSSKCMVCVSFKGRAKKDKETRLKFLLMEHGQLQRGLLPPSASTLQSILVILTASFAALGKAIYLSEQGADQLIRPTLRRLLILLRVRQRLQMSPVLRHQYCGRNPFGYTYH